MWGARWRGGMALSSLPEGEGIGSRFGAHAWMRQVFTEGGRWELSLLSSFSRPFLFLVLSHKQLLVGENIFLPNIPGSYTVADCTHFERKVDALLYLSFYLSLCCCLFFRSWLCLAPCVCQSLSLLSSFRLSLWSFYLSECLCVKHPAGEFSGLSLFLFVRHVKSKISLSEFFSFPLSLYLWPPPQLSPWLAFLTASEWRTRLSIQNILRQLEARVCRFVPPRRQQQCYLS